MSTLFEEAIADAKAVRASALANAKAALEEAFKPQVEAMLSQKLKEEAGMEEEGVFDKIAAGTSTSATTSAQTHYKSAGGKEANKGQETDVWKEGETQAVAPTATAPAPVPTGQGGQGAPVAEMANDETVSDKELEEILAELGQEMSEEGEVPAPAAPVAPAPEAPAAVAPEAPAAPVAPAPVAEHAEDQEEVDLNELLASLNESEKEEEKKDKEEETVDENYIDGKAGKEKDQEYGKAGKKVSGDQDYKKVSKECYENVIKERDDAVAAVGHYKKQINEVNLLNAKLLYTNKLFKNYPLSNEQKMKIVETFDLTQTLREVKIAYTSLAESFNFGKSAVKKTNTAAKTITEGLASKTVASTKPAPSVIVENTSAQAKRFQLLAGIKA
jgi:hypothetical protein